MQPLAAAEVIVGSLITGRIYHGRDPTHVVGHIGVDAVLASLATAIAKARHPHHRPPATHDAHQWPARVARTCVRPAVSVPRAEHIVGDTISPVRSSARPLPNDRNLRIIQTHISTLKFFITRIIWVYDIVSRVKWTFLNYVFDIYI